MRELWINYNGGRWWLQLDEASRAQFREAFVNLPLAMEVETASGVVGIVHADVPPLVTWSRFMALLQACDRDAALYSLWSRNRIQGGSGARSPVRGGVERVYCGHTPTRTTLRLDNVHYIDTARCTSTKGMPARNSRRCRFIRKSTSNTRYEPRARHKKRQEGPYCRNRPEIHP